MASQSSSGNGTSTYMSMESEDLEVVSQQGATWDAQAGGLPSGSAWRATCGRVIRSEGLSHAGRASNSPTAASSAASHSRIQQAGSADVAAALPHCTHHLNIAVVGEVGTGKSTLVHNLLGALGEPSTACARLSVTAGGEELFSTSYRAEAPLATICFSVQEHSLDGSMHSTAAAAALVEHSFAAYHSAEAAHLAPAYQLADKRADVCLLLVPPHGGISGCLQQAAAELAASVPVIPLLSMADTLTGGELEERKRQVRSALGLEAGLGLGSLLLYPQQPDLLDAAFEAAGLAAVAAPISVVAGDEMDPSVCRFWPVRRYPWATIHAFDNPHSALLELRTLLLGPAFQPLKCATEARYRQWLQRTWAAASPLAAPSGPTSPAEQAAKRGTAGAAGAAEAGALPLDRAGGRAAGAVAWVRAVGERSTAATSAQGKRQHGGHTVSVSISSSQAHEQEKLGLPAASPPVASAATAEPAPEPAAEPAAGPAVGLLPAAAPATAAAAGEATYTHAAWTLAEAASEAAAGPAVAPGAGPGSGAPPTTAAAGAAMLAAATSAPAVRPAAAAAAAGVDAVDAEGRTALHRAARAGNAQEVQQLLARGASLDVVDEHGATPAHYASVDGGIRLVQALLDGWKRRGTVPGPHKLMAAEEIAQMRAMRAMLREWSSVQQTLAAGSRSKGH